MSVETGAAPSEITCMNRIRSRHHTGSLWATLGGSPWATADNGPPESHPPRFRSVRRPAGGGLRALSAHLPSPPFAGPLRRALHSGDRDGAVTGRTPGGPRRWWKTTNIFRTAYIPAKSRHRQDGLPHTKARAFPNSVSTRVVPVGH
jgi:hypothetical protein